jgi:hypothetical protein
LHRTSTVQFDHRDLSTANLYAVNLHIALSRNARMVLSPVRYPPDPSSVHLALIGQM